MKTKIKNLSILLAAAVLAATAAQAEDKPASKADELFPDTVMAKGKGIEVKRTQFDEALASVKATAMSRGQQISPEQMPLLEKQVFDRLLLNKLLTAKATDADRAKGKEEGDKRFEVIKKRAASEEALAKQLKAINLTIEALHTKLIEEAVPEAALRSKIKITDDQVKKYYEEHPSDFEEPEKARASHILLLTSDAKTGAPMTDDQKKAKHKQMEELLKRARAGEDFAKLAKENSEDSGSKDTGGEYTFPRGGRMVPEEFEAAAFSLKTNQISDIVTTSYGYHIIKLSEKIPARKAEFAKVSVDLKNYLEDKEIQKMLPDYFASLRKEAGVEVLDTRLKALEDAPAPVRAPAPGSNGAK